MAFTVALALSSAVRAADATFIRGDANSDGAVELADAVFVLDHLFLGKAPPACFDAADGNDDGAVDTADAIYVLGFLFLGRAPLAAPFPQEGPDPTKDTLSCPAPEPVLLRRGGFTTLQHGVRGRVEHLSDHTIRLVDFDYDGEGLPVVLVWLHKGFNLGDQRAGYGIGEDLRGRKYDDETLTVAIPEEITDDMFNYVSIWCTSFPLNYGYAQLFPAD